MVHKANRYFQNLKTKGILSIFKWTKRRLFRSSLYSNIDSTRALWNRKKSLAFG